MRPRALFVLVVVALVSCRNGGADEPRTTVPTAPTSAATTATTAVSYDVPATIDVPYIEKVMTALDHVEGEAVRRVKGQGSLDEDFVRTLAAIYHSEAADLTQQGWLEVAGGDFQALASPPGDPKTTVQRIISASPSCMFVAAERDFSAMFGTPDPPGSQRYIALVPVPGERNPGGLNPTPWAMSFDGHFTNQTEPTPEEACAS